MYAVDLHMQALLTTDTAVSVFCHLNACFKLALKTKLAKTSSWNPYWKFLETPPPPWAAHPPPLSPALFCLPQLSPTPLHWPSLDSLTCLLPHQGIGAGRTMHRPTLA